MRKFLATCPESQNLSSCNDGGERPVLVVEVLIFLLCDKAVHEVIGDKS